jgi:hypothetical protein
VSVTLRVIDGQFERRRLLAIDPSSTAVGWAVADVDQGKIVAGGVIRPPERRPMRVRIGMILDGVAKLIGDHQPRWAVIEVPSGRPGRGSKGGATGHLGIYGVAVGMIAHLLDELVPTEAIAPTDDVRVDWVTEREWTRSIARAKRTVRAHHIAPGLDWSIDHGADMADAVGIAAWWLVERRRADLMAEAGIDATVTKRGKRAQGR